MPLAKIFQQPLIVLEIKSKISNSAYKAYYFWGLLASVPRHFPEYLRLLSPANLVVFLHTMLPDKVLRFCIYCSLRLDWLSNPIFGGALFTF